MPQGGPIRGVLLDFYGTIVHEDHDVVMAAAGRIAAAASVAVTREQISELWMREYQGRCAAAFGGDFTTQFDIEVMCVAAVADAVGAKVDVEAIVAESVRFWQAPPAFEDGLRMLDGGFALPWCLNSNTDRADLDAALSHHGLTAERIVTSEDVRAYKPRREGFLAALTALGLDAGEVIHVGDSQGSDVGGAAAVGIRSVWLNRSGEPARATVVAPWAMIGSLDELPALLG